ncbi:hypothetical protein [Ochrobactrum sp. BTU1]|uniref:hypothetical protein n=1 Tax=Ochrobactrum sp. BTU1 TaxID=2840456 RepID=UPI001C0409AE|nr:hypothetical protein KMS41_16770 [Ochrobactrum sp. BTU1]
MINNGYDIRLETDGTWTVIDVFKGEPVAIKGHLQVGLTESDANEALDGLSRKYSERHDEGGSGRLP